MDLWSPLFGSVVASSVWGEKPHVKIVWITMLALKDKHGFVGGSVPGLARLAVVSLEECEDALERFSSPDPHSSTKDYEGRRIKAIEGGWVVLNHAKFQKKMREVSTLIGNAKRQASWRERHAVKKGAAIGAVRTPEEDAAIQEREMAAHEKVKSAVQELNSVQSEKGA